jgi:hypothetical protein
MRINRKSIASGLTVGLLAGGAGGALAVTRAGSLTAGTSATTTWGGDGGWGGYGYAPGWSENGASEGAGQYGDLGAIIFGRTAITAAASYLGLTTAELKCRLRSGESLACIAISQQKSVSGLKSAILAAISTRAHSDTRLSAGQRRAIIAAAKRRIGSIVATPCPTGDERAFGAY